MTNLDQANAEYVEVDYDELIRIDNEVRKEYDYDQLVDLHLLRCMGNIIVVNVNPVDDPARIIEHLCALKRDQIISMIQFCEKRGWDWDIDPYLMDVGSKEVEYQSLLEDQRSFPIPGQ